MEFSCGQHLVSIKGKEQRRQSTMLYWGTFVFRKAALEMNPLPLHMHWFLDAAAMNKASNSYTQLFRGSSGSSARDDYIHKPHFSPRSASEEPFMLQKVYFSSLPRQTSFMSSATLRRCSVISKHCPVSQKDHPVVALQIILIFLPSYSRVIQPAGDFGI